MFFALLGSSFCILAVSKGPTQEITNRTLFHFLEVIPSRRLFNVAQVLVFKIFWVRHAAVNFEGRVFL